MELDYFDTMRQKLMNVHRIGQLLILCVIAVSSCRYLEIGEPSLEEHLARLRPRTPQEALSSFQVAEGFHIELVAAEPEVTDPIAMAFDEHGGCTSQRCGATHLTRLPEGGPAGRIRLLTDSNADGVFESSVIFADRVHWPSGVACWKGGVFILAPPDIFHMKDTTGDGVADVRRVVFSGFGTSKSEDIANNLKWGLDNWIYGASSYHGGEVRHAERATD